MSRSLFAAAGLACLAALGCAPSVSQKLVGTWVCDAQEAAKTLNAPQGTPAGAKEFLLGVVQAMNMKIEVQFHPDQTATFTGSFLAEMKSGPTKWKVTQSQGNEATIEFVSADGSSAAIRKITFLDDDHFQYASPSGGTPLVFRRVKPPQ